MYDNTTQIDRTKYIFESFPEKRKGVFDVSEVSIANKWVKDRIQYEIDFGVGTVSQQKEWFDFLLGNANEDLSMGYVSLKEYSVFLWALQTENILGQAYSYGIHNGHVSASDIEIKKQREKMIESAKRAGSAGGAARHKSSTSLKTWVDQQPEATDDKLNRTARARKLADKMPKHYALKLDDPVRVIRDYLKQKDQLRLASQP